MRKKQVSCVSVLSTQAMSRSIDAWMPFSLHLGLSSLEREMSMMMMMMTVAKSEAATAMGYRITGARGDRDPRPSVPVQVRHPRAGQKEIASMTDGDGRGQT